MSSRSTRREFIRSAAVGTAAVLLAACGEPSVITETVVETVVVEKEVEKVVKETVVVEKQVEKVVTMPPAPSKYSEAPMLAERVQAGTLPPVEERLPSEPVVTKPTRMVGKYGGTAYGEGISPNVTHDMQIVNTCGLFDFNNDLSEMTPLLATSFEFSDDYKACTIHLREGIKWSDGVPFTVDDVMFFIEDIAFNADYSPSTSRVWTPGGEKAKVTKVDDFTIRFDFAVPNPAFYLIHKSSAPQRVWWPKHYLKDLHPRYNSKADDEAKAEGFNNWQAKMGRHLINNYGIMEPGVPTLDPWVCTENSTTHQYYERNPYYYEVDTDGNQLPYIDKWVVELAQNLETFNLRAISGSLSVAGLNLLLANYPLLKENEASGDYTITMVYAELGADVALGFNQIHPDPVLGEIFRDKRFRQAMSVAIDRDSINELVFLGLGTPRQATMHETASFFKQEWADHFAEYDPDLANKLLDEMGLDKRNSEGTRLMKDGRPLAFMLEYVAEEGPKKEVCEIVAKDWADIGVKVDPQQREKNYVNTRQNAQEQDCTGWQVDRTLERAFWVEGWVGSKLGPGGNSVVTYAAQWKQWLQSQGQAGTEPPEEAKELVQLFDEWQTYPFGTPEYTAAGIKVGDKIADVLWIIGVIGQGPTPVIVSNKLENVFPDNVLSGENTFWWGASEWFLLPTRAEQWFFK